MFVTGIDQVNPNRSSSLHCEGQHQYFSFTQDVTCAVSFSPREPGFYQHSLAFHSLVFVCFEKLTFEKQPFVRIIRNPLPGLSSEAFVVLSQQGVGKLGL